MAGEIKALADNVYRDWPTPGVPEPGNPWRPPKPDIRALFGLVDEQASAAAAGVYARQTWPAPNGLAGITPTVEGSRGEVTNDAGTHTDPVSGATVANQGIFSWHIGVGWERIADNDLAGLQAAVDALEAEFVAGADIAAAATTDIGASTGMYLRVTGTTPITSFGTAGTGTVRFLRFANTGLVLTHHSTQLILPGLANISTASNDTAGFVSIGAGNWLCLFYKRTNGKAVIGPVIADITDAGAFGKLMLDTETSQAAVALLDLDAVSETDPRLPIRLPQPIDATKRALDIIVGSRGSIIARWDQRGVLWTKYPWLARSPVQLVRGIPIMAGIGFGNAASGYRLPIRIGTDGAVYLTEPVRPTVYVGDASGVPSASGDIWVVHADADPERITDGLPFVNPVVTQDGLAILASADLGDGMRSYRVSMDGEFVALADGGSVLEGVIHIGQSRAVATVGAEGIYTTARSNDALMAETVGLQNTLGDEVFDVAAYQSLAPIKSIASAETGLPTMLWAMLDELGTFRPSEHRFHALGSPLGSSAYSALKKGGTTNSYLNTVQLAQQTRALAAARGWTYRPRFLINEHGEQDTADGTTAAAYQGYLVEWRDDYAGDLDSPSMLMFASQNTRLSSGPALGLVAAHKAVGSKIIATCPIYFMPHTDTVHQTSESYVFLKSYHRRAILSTFYKQRRWEPLRIASWVYNPAGPFIDVTYLVPEPPLQLDTAWYANATGGRYGYKVVDSGGVAPTINSVTLRPDGITIRVLLSAAFSSPAAGTLEYAYSVAAPASRLPYNGVHGNVHDSSPDICPWTGLAMYNWAMTERIVGF